MSMESFDTACRHAMQATKLANNCLGASVLLVEALHRYNFRAYVALGTLKTAGKLTFQYEPLPEFNNAGLHLSDWGGHAWVQLMDEDIIVDITLFATAANLNEDSNLRQQLEDQEGFGRPLRLVFSNDSHPEPLEYQECENLEYNTEYYNAIMGGQML